MRINRNILLGLFLVFVISQGKSQEQFVSFFPNWRSHKIIELEEHFISYGLAGASTFHQYQFNRILPDGTIDSTWTFAIDTANTTTAIPYPQGILAANNGHYIAGIIRGEETEKIYATLMHFNEGLTDTLFTRLYDFSTDTRLYQVIENSKGNLIATGFQEIEQYDYHPFIYEMDFQGNVLWEKILRLWEQLRFIYPSYIGDR
jgi:hypothetical protein